AAGEGFAGFPRQPRARALHAERLPHAGRRREAGNAGCRNGRIRHADGTDRARPHCWARHLPACRQAAREKGRAGAGSRGAPDPGEQGGARAARPQDRPGDLSLGEQQAREGPARRLRPEDGRIADPALPGRDARGPRRGHRPGRRADRRRPDLRHRLRAVPRRPAALPRRAEEVTRMGKASAQQPGLALPAGKVPALRVVPMPADSNQNGDIFGGWIMAQVDVAGGIVAGRVARGRVATVSVNSFVFKQPVQIGDVLSLYADVVRIGNTSITVDVQVYAERGREEAKVVKFTEAALTYVAIYLQGKPRQVPKG